MEIDITDWLKAESDNAANYSGSVAERGPNAGRETWSNAMAQAAKPPLLLLTREEIDAVKDHLRGMGFSEEMDDKPDNEVRALFIQLISGDLRELEQATVWNGGKNFCEITGIDWDAVRSDQEQGQISSNMFRGDVPGNGEGRIFYCVE